MIDNAAGGHDRGAEALDCASRNQPRSDWAITTSERGHENRQSTSMNIRRRPQVSHSAPQNKTRRAGQDVGYAPTRSDHHGKKSRCDPDRRQRNIDNPVASITITKSASSRAGSTRGSSRGVEEDGVIGKAEPHEINHLPVPLHPGDEMDACIPLVEEPSENTVNHLSSTKPAPPPDVPQRQAIFRVPARRSPSMAAKSSNGTTSRAAPAWVSAPCTGTTVRRRRATVEELVREVQRFAAEAQTRWSVTASRSRC